MWSGTAHYLVADGEAARVALDAAGLGPVVAREALLADLDVDVPGALGRMMERLVRAEVILLGQYSDHDNRKVLIVDDIAKARESLKAMSA